jgi:hypothetical protein
MALVEALPETGRTHQIRVHLAWAGTPLAVDPDYGEKAPLVGPDGEPLLARTPLHAAAVALRHPASGERLEIAAPLPEDMARVIAAARAAGALGCVLSGAGPSILVFYERGCEAVCDVVRQIFALHGHDSETLFCTIPERGFELEREGA